MDMVNKKKISILWGIWVIIWPLILWVSYNHYYLNVQDQIMDILLFASFMVLVALFPLKVNNYEVFFTNGISIVVFLMFGLFVEIVLTQIVIIIVLLNAGVRFQESFRFPLNMLSLSIVSILSAEVFYLAGGTHSGANYENPKQLLAAGIYAVIIIIFNTLFNKLIDRYFYNRDYSIFGKEEKLEFTTLLLVFPVGYVLYILYTEIGTLGIFYLGVPFVFISVIIQLLYSYQELNDYLSKTSKIGHLLTKNLSKEEVYEIFMRELQGLIQTDYIRVFFAENGELKLKKVYNKDEREQATIKVLETYNSFSKKVWETKKPIVYNHAREWSGKVDDEVYRNIESIVSLPIEYGNEVVGVVTSASRQKRKFENFHVEIMDILTTYLGIAIHNAENLELTRHESNIDGLTQIYNYKYFESIVSSYEATFKDDPMQKYYSMILLDIDLFKQVNDTYGHEAGNEVLTQLASRLVFFVGDLGVVARYGGEEFAIFLPNFTSSDAHHLATKICNDIRNRKFISYKHILNHQEPVSISITVSVGIATYPTHCRSLLELIRHADRAMYVGAKNKGRDRIAVYEEILR